MQLWHDSSLPFADSLIGEVTVTVAELLSQCENSDHLELSLHKVSGDSASTVKSGTLLVHVTCPSTVSMASQTLGVAMRTVEPKNAKRSSTDTSSLVGQVSEVGVVGDGVALLDGLLTKLDVVMGIVGEVSKVAHLV